LSAGQVRKRFILGRGWNTITVTARRWPPGTEVPVVIDFDDKSVTKQHAMGEGERRLTALFKGMGFTRPGADQ
jgi:hypothetical protein